MLNPLSKLIGDDFTRLNSKNEDRFYYYEQASNYDYPSFGQILSTIKLGVLHQILLIADTGIS